MDKITILGVGNILMQDDGFGVRVIERLQQMVWPENIKIIDGGTLGMVLLPYIEGTTKLLIVDAINADGRAGDFFCYKGNDVNTYFSNKISIHDLGINDLLASLKITGDPVQEIIVMGVKPAVVELGMELTDAVANEMESTVNKIIDLLKQWQTMPIATVD
ncbi:HyaD/HybD family hydrogenase maturation endopeptidase [Pectinatus frisingensis]|mgnify:CR=1 FL=1|jgi:hydrogenase maturation protease|uniref:HyaD/HybD family hydrogenase maturation endopeptidase n=1 Tax=Pectinatus frisingensis TaxID=865 RepID=UPI0015F70368|nr:HyaD/HybD family hydrogenase maturation endopeptidase [Pectinatus frisingensis]